MRFYIAILHFYFQLSKVLDGEYSHVLDETIIVDCRYPYEFDGGHIKVSIIHSMIIYIVFIYYILYIS